MAERRVETSHKAVAWRDRSLEVTYSEGDTFNGGLYSPSNYSESEQR